MLACWAKTTTRLIALLKNSRMVPTCNRGTIRVTRCDWDVTWCRWWRWWTEWRGMCRSYWVTPRCCNRTKRCWLTSPNSPTGSTSRNSTLQWHRFSSFVITRMKDSVTWFGTWSGCWCRYSSEMWATWRSSVIIPLRRWFVRYPSNIPQCAMSIVRWCWHWNMCSVAAARSCNGTVRSIR